MKCSYCDKRAKCKCKCIKPYMCETHFGEHLIIKGVHEYEQLVIDIGETELNELRAKVIEKMNQVRVAKIDLNQKTKWLLKQIEVLHNNAEELLNNLAHEYFEIFMHSKFCSSEIPKIEEIMTSEIFVKNAEFGEIIQVIEGFYPREIRYLDQKVLILSGKANEEQLESSKN